MPLKSVFQIDSPENSIVDTFDQLTNCMHFATFRKQHFQKPIRAIKTAIIYFFLHSEATTSSTKYFPALKNRTHHENS